MRNLYLYIILLFTVNNMLAQDPNNHWKLGVSDLDFSTNPPLVSNISGWGFGSASISDANGDLLFYTDGEYVFNKNHQSMGGPVGATNYYNEPQAAVIVPHPGNPNQYYLFLSRTGVLLDGGSPNYAYRYLIVDFSDPNHPLGKLLDSSYTYLSYPMSNENIPFKNGFTYRPITVVKNATNDGYFVIVQDNGASTFLAYRITSAGLNLAPIVSSITNDTTFEEYNTSEFTHKPFGTIKFTPDNTTLGVLVRNNKNHIPTNNRNYSSRFFTLNFNNSTGVFSSFKLIDDVPLSSAMNVTDFEFSGDSQKVYLLRDKIYVKNLSSLFIPPARDLADFSNSSSVPTGFENIQRDKYGNILISSSQTVNSRNKYLHRISDQNSYSSSSVELNNIYLNNNTYPFGYSLPQLVPELVEPCLADVSITAAISTGIDKKQASNTITASNIINTGTGAIYHAASSVKLSNGFHAKAGATFRAYIEGCSNNYAARMASSDEETQIEYSVEEKSKATLYPNPNKGVFTITIDESIKEILQVEIYNSYGKIVQMNTIDPKNIAKEFNLVDTPAGIYFVKVSGKNINENIKFVKQ